MKIKSFNANLISVVLPAIIICSVIVGSFSSSATWAAAGNGTDTQPTQSQIDSLQSWINTTQNALADTLSQIRSKDIPHAYAILRAEITTLLTQHEPRVENLLGYFALARALKADALLSTSGVDLRLSILWSASEIALNEIKSASAQRLRGDFGIDYSLFLMASSENALNATAQLDLAHFTLGLLSVDLADDPRSAQFASSILALTQYLDLQKSAVLKNDSDRLSQLRAARTAYELSLKELKGTALDAAVADTENPTLEYNRRVLRRNLSSNEAQVQAVSMQKLSSLSATSSDQVLILSKIADPSLTICSAAYAAIESQTHLDNSLIFPIIDIITSSNTPMSCRYAAIMLTTRFERTAVFESLHPITREVVSGKEGLYYPDGDKNMVLPIELNFAAQMVVFGANPAMASISQFCTQDICVGNWALITKGHGTLGPVVQVNDQNQVKLFGSDKWVDRKDYFRRVDSINGFSTDELVIKKNTSTVVRQFAETTDANNIQAGMILRNTKGRIEHLFENGYVVLRNVDQFEMEWVDMISDLLAL